MPAGRPSSYTPERGQAVCRGIAEGRKLKDICAEDDMPSTATFFRWLAEQEQLRDLYTHAKYERAYHYVDEIVEIADETTGDVMRDRLRVDTRKWAAAKLNPKSFGDKIAHTGEDGGPVQVTVAQIDVSQLQKPEDK